MKNKLAEIKMWPMKYFLLSHAFMQALHISLFLRMEVNVVLWFGPISCAGDAAC